jgi:hypothetical protein
MTPDTWCGGAKTTGNSSQIAGTGLRKKLKAEIYMY